MDDASSGAALSPLVVISPHYDDAVFSCGDLLLTVPLCTVITVCTGQPENASLLTDWDKRCGFSSAADAMQTRAAENSQALAILGAQSLDLGFLDSQYPQTHQNGADLLCDTLASALSLNQPKSVLFPLGLFHTDHIDVSDALTTLCPRFKAINWLVYEDIPYSKRAEHVLKRTAQLMSRGLSVTPLYPEGLKDHKEMAVCAYASQLIGLGYKDAQPIMHQPEKYWQMHCNVELL